VWGKSRQGKNVVRQVTAKQCYARALAAVTEWCRQNRHLPIPEQHTQLVAKMRGHYAYYGCAGILGKKQEVKVHYDEGLAIHIDPESCADTREGLGDALTGGRIGQVTEPRKSISLGCRRCP